MSPPIQRTGRTGTSRRGYNPKVATLQTSYADVAQLFGRAGMTLTPTLALGGATLRRTVDALPDGSALAFYVRRDGSTQTLSGSLRSIELPPMRLTVGAGTRLAAADVGGRDVGASDGLSAGCGRISDFDTAPRQQQLHGAKIISIDGRTPGPSGSKAYRVTAGTHEVKVAEDIESRYLSFSDRARLSGPATRRYKTLAVDVAPGTTTLIAARLIESERNNPTDGAYWEPVAWKQVEEACD